MLDLHLDSYFALQSELKQKNPHLTKVEPLKAVEKDFKGIATPNSFGNKKIFSEFSCKTELKSGIFEWYLKLVKLC